MAGILNTHYLMTGVFCSANSRVRLFTVVALLCYDRIQSVHAADVEEKLGAVASR